MGLYKKLVVWNKSMDLVEKIYKVSLPDEEKFGLVSQLRRSAVSVPSNIAEGNGRNSDKDFCRFLNIAIGSLFEMQTQIEICFRLKYVQEEQYNEIINLSREVEAMLASLIKKLSHSVS
ncbi:MAG: four helix bundle protein [Arcobacteraceae bacterium]|nr:four helix bundle protein [Arcobacteraceae bacterium]MDY0328115.1 four helix bundle protein [Arcobacteraceae bacterium]